jgi:excisionase family DNA binding protein
MDSQDTLEAPALPSRPGYSVAEAELMSGFSRATLYRLMERGELAFVKVGERRLIPADELKRMTDAKPAPEVQHPRDQFSTPLVTNAHLILVDIRRSDGRQLLVKLLGWGELGRVLARTEPYVAAMQGNGGASRSIIGLPDEEQLSGFLSRVLVLGNFPQRISYGLAPELTQKLTERAGHGGAAGGRA